MFCHCGRVFCYGRGNVLPLWENVLLRSGKCSVTVGECSAWSRKCSATVEECSATVEECSATVEECSSTVGECSATVGEWFLRSSKEGPTSGPKGGGVHSRLPTGFPTIVGAARRAGPFQNLHSYLHPAHILNFEKEPGLLYGKLSDRRTRLHGDSRKNIARPLDLLVVEKHVFA